MAATMMPLFGEVLAQLLAGQTLHLAVGSGLTDWDGQSPVPQPPPTRTGLYNELARAVATVSYIDATGAVSVAVTRRIEAAATFGTGVANGTLREMGLFVFGSGTLGSGKLIAANHFTAIVKPSGGGDFALPRLFRLALLGAT